MKFKIAVYFLIFSIVQESCSMEHKSAGKESHEYASKELFDANLEIISRIIPNVSEDIKTQLIEWTQSSGQYKGNAEYFNNQLRNKNYNSKGKE
jgi:hypothetical protein